MPSREGGVEIVVEELSTRLVQLGNEVHVYNRKGKNVQNKNVDKENKKIKEILYKLPNKSLSFKQKLLLLFIKNRWYLLLAVMLKIFI